LQTPLDKIESEVEQYFDRLHAKLFEHSAPFAEFAANHWTDDLESYS
jgi:hypothetical protein